MTTPRAGADVFAPLEMLEGRSLLSATLAPPLPDPALATPLNGGGVIADADFLNPDPAPATGGATPGSDADMYDFGGAWGSKPAAPGTAHRTDIDGAFDDGAPRRVTPSDLSATPLRPDQAVSVLRDSTEDTDGPADTTVANGGGPITVSTPVPYNPQAADSVSISIGTGADTTKARTSLTTTIQPAEIIKIKRTFLR